MHLELAWRVSGLQNLLGELVTEVLDRDDAQGIFGDGDHAFMALFGAEGADMGKSFVTHGCDSVVAHVVVAEPGLVGQGYHGVFAVLLDLGQLDLSWAQELVSGV